MVCAMSWAKNMGILLKTCELRLYFRTLSACSDSVMQSRISSGCPIVTALYVAPGRQVTVA